MLTLSEMRLVAFGENRPDRTFLELLMMDLFLTTIRLFCRPTVLDMKSCLFDYVLRGVFSNWLAVSEPCRLLVKFKEPRLREPRF